jgi:hypothetical protein
MYSQQKLTTSIECGYLEETSGMPATPSGIKREWYVRWLSTYLQTKCYKHRRIRLIII